MIANKWQTNNLPLKVNSILSSSPSITGGLLQNKSSTGTAWRYIMAIKAGLWLGSLLWMLHLPASKSFPPVARYAMNLMEYSQPAWINAVPTNLRKLNIIQTKAAQLIHTFFYHPIHAFPLSSAQYSVAITYLLTQIEVAQPIPQPQWKWLRQTENKETNITVW